MTTVASGISVKVIRSPGFMPRLSLISLGIVVWPLLVSVASVGIANSSNPYATKYSKDREKRQFPSDSPRGRLTYIDCAGHLLLATELSTVELPINIGCGYDLSIRELAQLIASVIGYQGDIGWDTSKPDGTLRKLLDSSRINVLGWRPATALEAGIRHTYASFLESSHA